MSKVSIAFQTDKPPGRYAALAQAAEGYGFDGVSVFADLLYQPPLPALLEMAGATSRVRLGAACFNPYTQHPYEIAGAVAALSAASGGRAYLGLAPGAWLTALRLEQPQPVAALRDAIGVVQALLSGADHDGPVFGLAPGTRLRSPEPAAPPPVLIGAWGPRLAALAGELADELKVGGSANPAMVAVMRERIAVGAGRVGRRADDVGIVFGAVTVVDEDGPAARARARREVAMYLALVADLDPTADVPADLLDRVRACVAAGDDAAAGALVPDDVLDLFAFAGTPDEVAEHADAVLAAGASRVEFGTPHGLTDGAGVDLLGRRVLPLLRERIAARGQAPPVA